MTKRKFTHRSVLPPTAQGEPTQRGLKFRAPYKKRPTKRGHWLHCAKCNKIMLHEMTEAGAICQGKCETEEMK